MSLIYLESPSTDPYFNLALEQTVFDDFPREQEYFMFWQNDRAVIIGKNQNTIAEINQHYVEEHGVRVARRLSGGGAVYHDLGNLNFTFIVDERELGAPGRLDLSTFCTMIAQALQSLGVDAQVNGRNDITIDGKKFSGNSQYIKEGRVMHHGTILFDADLEIVSKVLRVSEDKIADKGIKSVRSRVTNLRSYLPQDVTLEQFRRRLLETMFPGQALPRHELTPQELSAIERRRSERYATWSWNYGVSPAYHIQKKRRIEGVGSVEALMDIAQGRITALAFCGDYFGSEDSAQLAAQLIGCVADVEPLTQVLAGLQVGRYFHNMEPDELVRLLTR